jgi:hypothetical protein
MSKMLFLILYCGMEINWGRNKNRSKGRGLAWWRLGMETERLQVYAPSVKSWKMASQPRRPVLEWNC